MTNQPTVTQEFAEEFFGEVTPLTQCLGSADGLVALGRATNGWRFQRVTDLMSLSHFLRDYHCRVLMPVELPAISRAYGHAHRFEVRELIALDQQLASEPALQDFATASQHVGKTQLKRLRPLRDQRLVQRYLRAVQAGEAHAWHTLVYGMVLSLYSLPLRQGLLSYAQQTTRGFVSSVAGRLHLTGDECRGLIDHVFAGFPAAVETALSANGPLKLLVL